MVGGRGNNGTKLEKKRTHLDFYGNVQQEDNYFEKQEWGVILILLNKEEILQISLSEIISQRKVTQPVFLTWYKHLLCETSWINNEGKLLTIMGKVLKILAKAFLKNGFLTRSLPQNHHEPSLKCGGLCPLLPGPLDHLGQSPSRCLLSAHFRHSPKHCFKAGI